VVLDGKEGPEVDGLNDGTLLFSPDSQRVAYVVRSGDKRRVVVDGEEGAEYDRIGDGFPVFSPHSRHVAYPAKRGSKQLVVVGGKESQEYEAVWPLVFDGPKRIRFVATRYDESLNKELLRVEIEIVEEQP
jgi:hypothetical protein